MNFKVISFRVDVADYKFVFYDKKVEAIGKTQKYPFELIYTNIGSLMFLISNDIEEIKLLHKYFFIVSGFEENKSLAELFKNLIGPGTTRGLHKRVGGRYLFSTKLNEITLQQDTSVLPNFKMPIVPIKISDHLWLIEPEINDKYLLLKKYILKHLNNFGEKMQDPEIRKNLLTLYSPIILSRIYSKEDILPEWVKKMIDF